MNDEFEKYKKEMDTANSIDAIESLALNYLKERNKPFDKFFAIAEKFEPVERAERWLEVVARNDTAWSSQEAFVYLWSQGLCFDLVNDLKDSWDVSFKSNMLNDRNYDRDGKASKEIGYLGENILNEDGSIQEKFLVRFWGNRSNSTSGSATMIRLAEWGRISELSRWIKWIGRDVNSDFYSTTFDDFECGLILFNLSRSGHAIEQITDALISGLSRLLKPSESSLQSWQFYGSDLSVKTSILQIASTLFSYNRLRHISTIPNADVTHSQLLKLLLDNQRSDGSWSSTDIDSDPCLLTTCIATHALFADTKESKIEIKKAKEWIMSVQDPMGYWCDGYTSQSVYQTVLALDTLRLGDIRTQTTMTNPRLDKIKKEIIYRTHLDLGRAIYTLGTHMERLPSTTTGKGEEDLRDLFLIMLSTLFKTSNSGETINCAGKTDIMIRSGQHTVLICECKFWHGKKAFLKCISQLYSYLSRHDNYAMIILFFRGNSLRDMMTKADKEIKNHRSFLRTLYEYDFDFIKYSMAHPSDPSETLTLDLVAFDFK